MKRYFSSVWIAEGLLAILLILSLSLLTNNLIIYWNIKETIYKVQIDPTKISNKISPPAEIKFNGRTYDSIYMQLINDQTARGSKLLRKDAGRLISNSGTSSYWDIVGVYEIKGISPNIAVAVKFDGYSSNEYTKYVNKDYLLNHREVKMAILMSLLSIVFASTIVLIYVKLIKGHEESKYKE